MLTKNDLKKLGFKSLPHFTVLGSLIYDLGRHRHLSVGCVGTPNEVVFICSSDRENEKEITDLICLHNYDHDGYLTEEKVNQLIGLKSKK